MSASESRIFLDFRLFVAHRVVCCTAFMLGGHLNQQSQIVAFGSRISGYAAPTLAPIRAAVFKPAAHGRNPSVSRGAPRLNEGSKSWT